MTKEYYVLAYKYEYNYKSDNKEVHSSTMYYLSKYSNTIDTLNLEDAVKYSTFEKAERALNNYYRLMDKYTRKTIKWRDKRRKIQRIFPKYETCSAPYEEYVSCFGLDNEPRINHLFKIHKVVESIDIIEL